MEPVHDVVIIGAGSAGLSARREVAKRSHSYRVVDDGPLGTTCARVGCMPSKALIEVANAFHRRESFERFGILGGDALRVDGAHVMQHVRKLRDRFVAGVRQDMEDWEATHLIRGPARFVGSDGLVVDGQTLRARRFVLATGSAPIVPRALAALADRCLTTNEIFELESLPRSLAVVGSGVIGLELGQAFRRLGVAVTVYGAPDSLGGLSDPKIERYAREKLRAELPIVPHRVEAAELRGNDVRITAGGRTETFSHVLLAAGRRPRLQELDVERAGLTLDSKGRLVADPKTTRVGQTAFYLAGDARGDRPVLHEASDEGRIAGYNAVRSHDEPFRRRAPLTITFSSPNIAQVGSTYRQLTDAKTDFVVGEVSFEGQGRALVKDEAVGLLRLYGDRRTGRLLGAEMFAPGGEHLAHWLAALIDLGHTAVEALSRPFYHPVLEEGLRTALRHLAKHTEGGAPELELLRCEDPPSGA